MPFLFQQGLFEEDEAVAEPLADEEGSALGPSSLVASQVSCCNGCSG